MTKYQEVRLGDICIQITDGTHNTVKDCESGDCYLLSCKNIKNGNIEIGKNERKIDRHTLEELRKRTKTAKGDVLLSSVGTIGETAVIKLENPNYEFQRSVAIFKPNLNFITSEFLYYSLNSRKNILQHSAEGAVQQCLFITPLKDFPISLPPLDVQKKIAGVLGALDDKIELNNKINNNLEQQVQALFKSWFVDFEPFGGTMPDDWKIGKLEDVADFTNGYAFKSNELEDDPISGKDYYDVFKQGHIMRGGGLNLTGTKSYYPKDKAEKLGKYVLRKGDILMAMTDMKGNVAILGNTALMNIDDKYILNQRVGLLRCNNEYAISYPYVYILTNSFDFLKDLRNRANSGVQVNLSSAEIKNSDVIIPSRDINQGFNKIGEAIFEKIFANQQENIQLSALRDTLLPKLMSGEIDVSKVDINELNVADKLL